MNNCPCGEDLIGDGYTTTYHCPNSEDFIGIEADGNAVYCEYGEALEKERIELEKTFMVQTITFNKMAMKRPEFNKEVQIVTPNGKLTNCYLRSADYKFISTLISTITYFGNDIKFWAELPVVPKEL